ncbi:hypothetical protein [Burkholderia anthina]|uniref:hypothetical protein n=1 Tax=Burkholderia anthina TaxID=179879 RepID=UPI00158EE256|nr:hypothetical protein [Burkholderia anthina]
MLVKRQVRQLTEEAEAERNDFRSKYGNWGGCNCFISAPCSFCTHPGNPMNQNEDDECWETVEYAEFIDPREGSW